MHPDILLMNLKSLMSCHARYMVMINIKSSVGSQICYLSRLLEVGDFKKVYKCAEIADRDSRKMAATGCAQRSRLLRQASFYF